MIFEVVVACVHMAEKRGHKHPYAAWRCYWELWLLEDKLPQCKGEAHTVRGAIGSRCGEAISQILLWNVVGSRGVLFFQSLARPASPALTHHRAQEQTPLLSATVNHVLGDPHTLEFRMRTRSSDISI